MSQIKDTFGLSTGHSVDELQSDRANHSAARAALIPDARVTEAANTASTHGAPRASDARATVRADLSAIHHSQFPASHSAESHDGNSSHPWQTLVPPTIQPMQPHDGDDLNVGLPALPNMNFAFAGLHGNLGGQVVFIDSGVRDLSALLSGIKPGMDVVLLDSHHDALDQIAETLAGHHGITAVHIIADGSSGQIDFSSGVFDSGNLATGSHAHDLAAIGKALTPQGDLMIWSCDTAQGQAGQSFMDALAQHTGADVAASTGITGAASLGGNWMLESHTGPIEAAAPLTAQGVDHFDSTLGVSLSIIYPAFHESINAYTNGELGFSYGTAGDSVFDDLFTGGTYTPGPNYYNSSNPTNFAQIGTDKVLFFATDATHGRELWITDGTEGGTSLLKDINSGTNSSVQGPGNDPTPVALGSNDFFAASDGTDGVELWETNGTTAGTNLVTNIGAGAANGGVSNLTPFNNHLYFSAFDGTTNHGYQAVGLWETDGTTTAHVFTPTLGASAFYAPTISELVATGSHLFFAGYNGVGTGPGGTQVYVSDGTTGGTHLLDPGDPTVSFPAHMTGIDGKLWWSQSDSGSTGDELWVSDGTTTTQIAIAPGAASSTPSEFVGMNGEVFFSANDGSHGIELWESDGSQGGTVMVKDINSGSGSALNVGVANQMVAIGSTLYFVANDGVNGAELWKTNGQVGNATLVKDINTIPANGSSPIDLQDVNGTLYFFANDGGHEGLFKSDGSSAGTIELASNVNEVGNNPSFSFLPAGGGPVIQGEPDSFVTDEATPITTQNLFNDNGSGPDTGTPLTVAEVNDSAGNVGHQITLASGAHLTVNSDGTFIYDPNHAFDYLPSASSGASNLSTTDSFTYMLTGGSGDVSVTITINGLDSDDLLIGTGGGDTLTPGTGNDTVQAGGGADTINMAGNLTAADQIDGGTGNDIVNLNGTYTGGSAVVMNATTMINVETIQLASGHSYSLTTNDTTVASGQTLTVDGSLLASGNTLTFNGSAETDGFFVLKGGAGADTFIMGAAMNATDQIAGGAGADAVTLNGAYTGGNALVLGAATMVNIETLTLAAGHDYSITTDDATVATGQNMVIDGSTLGASNSLTFDGSAETDGSFTVNGGNGNDTISGGAGGDTIVARSGNDTVNGNGGNDVLVFSAALTAADTIDGGTGIDTLNLNGDYSLGVTFGATTMVNVERIVLTAGHSYNLTTADATVAAGQTLTVVAGTLGSSDVLTFNGFADTDGSFIVTGGAGNDIISTANGNDVISGGAGNDTITAHSGNDVVSGNDGDDILNFSAALTAADKIDGGTGTDTVNLNGNYAAGVTFTATTMVNVERLALTAGHSYKFTTVDATVGAGQTLTVLASTLGASDTLTFTGSAETDGRFVITSGAGNDVLNGGNGNDTITGGAGNDTITAGTGNDILAGNDGNDTFVMHAALTAADRIDGGTGTDTVTLSGNYSGGVVFSATTMVNVEALTFVAGNSYTLTTNDATVASGQTLAVTGTALGASDVLTFNGAAETNGTFSFTGGAGNDVLTGGAGADSFSLIYGGNDTAKGGAGNDTFILAGTFTSADKIDGGADSDTVTLNGNYSGGVTFTATTMVNVETLTLATAHSYSLTTNNATVASGQTLTVNAAGLGVSDSLTFNGAAETDGHFVFKSGFGADTFTGGSQSDTFAFATAAASTSTHYDTINGLNFNSDKLDIPGAGTITGINPALATGTLDSGASFDSELTTALNGHLTANHAILFTANAGTLSGQTFLVVDLNGSASYQTGSDIVIHVSGATGTLAVSDFI